MTDHQSEDVALRKAAAQAVADLYSASGHEACTWEQVGPCVYCITHDVRLYQGRLPGVRRASPPCVEHRWDDGDSMSQCGFYLLCLDCGEQEWTV